MLRLEFFGQLLCILFVINDATLSSPSESCAGNDLEKCTNLIKPLLDNPQVAYPENEAQIMDACQHITEYLKCVNNFANRCYESPGREQFLAFFKGYQSYTNDLCTPGSWLSTEILKYSSCYKTAHSELKQCADESWDSKAMVEKKMKEDVPREEKITFTCCTMSKIKHCVFTPILGKCGKQAAEVGMQTWDRLQAESLRALCHNVTHDAPECSAASFITISSFFSFALVVITVSRQLDVLHM